MRSGFASGINVEIQAVDGAPLEMQKGWLPAGAAKAVEAPVAVYRTKTTFPATLVTLLTPFSDAKDIPQVETLPSGDAQTTHLRLRFADGQQDELLIADRPMSLLIGDAKGFGRVLYVRQGPRGSGSAVLGAGVAGKKEMQK